MASPRKTRTRSKLVKAISEPTSSEKYRPTIKECREWFIILNKEIFEDRLDSFRNMKVSRRHGCWGEVTAEQTRTSRFTTLSMNHHFKSKKHFIEVLGHEMIHHYQLTVMNESMTHGETFFTWKDRFAKLGMSLTIES